MLEKRGLDVQLVESVGEHSLLHTELCEQIAPVLDDRGLLPKSLVVIAAKGVVFGRLQIGIDHGFERRVKRIFALRVPVGPGDTGLRHSRRAVENLLASVAILKQETQN